MSANTPLQKIKIACHLLRQVSKILFSNNAVAAINYQNESEKHDLKVISKLITDTKKQK